MSAESDLAAELTADDAASRKIARCSRIARTRIVGSRGDRIGDRRVEWLRSFSSNRAALTVSAPIDIAREQSANIGVEAAEQQQLLTKRPKRSQTRASSATACEIADGLEQQRQENG
jgi:hypothetical protein